MTSDDMALVWWGDACGGLAGNLPVAVILLFAGDFERGGCGVLVAVEVAGAEAGVVGEVGYEPRRVS